MKTFFTFILSITVLAAMSSPSFAVQSNSIRCNDNIVSVGDTAGELLAKCGDPAYTLRREEKNSHRGYFGERSLSIDVIDDWSYNFGPKSFQYRVILTNGIVTTIESLDYGY